MPKFICKKDFSIMNNLLIESGEFFNIETEKIFYTLDKEFSIKMNINQIRNNDEFFYEVKELEIITKEDDKKEDEEIKDYIVQVKVRTTRNKLSKIENFLKSEIEKIIIYS